MASILSGLITSKTRIRILMRLFLNSDQQVYLRELADEFGASPSQIRDELQHLVGAELLKGKRTGRQTYYRANHTHPLFPELHSMVKKALGMDRILESVVERLGNLEEALLVDDYAAGKDSGIIDLVLVGQIDMNSLNDLVGKTERYINRKIRALALTPEEYQRLKPQFAKRPRLVLWSRADTLAREESGNSRHTTSSLG